ncbi:response regulator transcription factor [Actinomarinicola tropica]|uniref:Response regulator n=1 Tax=Actinomarinicola tropica TaxID=2789776 RepID=A0A5Q2RLV6_9ACTN|nr:response regulator transcription factor [Actinomarinicola tropica]QGG96823.1 response regulator [Actinomarinicola tropica]
MSGGGAAVVRTIIVDDQEPFLAAAGAVVDRTPGFEVVGRATDGHAALALVDELSPDLVVMDVRMPGLDGIGAAQEMARRPHAPIVILVSSHARADLPAELERTGATYLHKEELLPARLTEVWERHGRTLGA